MFQLELVALNEVAGILVALGGLRHAPMLSAAIFKLGFTLLNCRFLDLKFGERGFGGADG